MKTLMRWALRLSLLLGVVTLLLITTVYFGLRSPLVERQLVPSLQPLLKEHGITLQLDTLRFDLLGHLVVRDLFVERGEEHPEGPFTLKLAALELRYDLWQLLDGRLVIDAITLDDLRISADMPRQPSANVTEAPEPSAALSLPQLTDMLANPPVEIVVKQIDLAPIAVDIRLHDANTSVACQGNIAMHGALEWLASSLQGRFALAMSETALKLAQQDTSEIRTHPRFDGQFAWQVHHHEEQWQLTLEPLALDLHTGHTTVWLHRGDEALTLALDDWRLMLQLAAQSDTWPLQQLPHPLTLQHRLDVNSTLQALTLAYQKAATTVALALDHHIALESRGKVTATIDPQAQPQSGAPLPLEVAVDVNHRVALQTFTFRHDGNQTLVMKQPLKQRLHVQLEGEADVTQPRHNALHWQLDHHLHGAPLHVTMAENTITTDPINMEITLQGKTLETANRSLLAALNTHLQLDLAPWMLQLQTDANGTMALTPEYHLRGALEGEHIKLESDLSLHQLNAPFLRKPLSPRHRLTLVGDTGWVQTTVQSTLNLEKETPLVDLTLGIANQADLLRLTPSLKLDIEPSLDQWFEQAKPLRQIGHVALKLEGETQIHHHAEAMHKADWSQLQHWPLESTWQMALNQLQPPEDGGVRLSGPTTVQLALAQTRFEHYRGDLALQSGGLLHPPLKKPLPLDLSIHTAFDKPLRDVTLDGDVNITHQPLLHLALQLGNQPQHLQVDAQWDLYGDPKWQQFLAAAQPLEQTGAIHLKSQMKLGADHPFKTVAAFDPATGLETLKAGLELNGTVEQTSGRADARVLLGAPITFHHAIDWQQQAASLDAGYRIGDLTLPGQLHLRQMALDLSARTDHGLEPGGGILKLAGTADELALLGDNPPMQLAPLLFPLDLTLEGELVSADKQADVKQFRFSLGGGLLRHALSGVARLDGKMAVLHGEAALQLRERLLPTLSGSGGLKLPWRVTLVDKGTASRSKLLSLHGALRFDDLAVATEQMQLSGMNGRVSLDEELWLNDDGNVSFGYLLTPDPFQRVDYNRIEPYLNDQEQITIEALQLGDVKIGPLQATVPIKQNLIRLQQFNLKLLGGHVAGQFYLNTTPGAWSVGLLSRVTQVDIRRMLQDGDRFEAAPISARTALEFDLAQRLLQGRIDITDISQAQLLQLLELMDPNHVDEQLGQVRSALGFAHPERVAIHMDRGLLDLGVSLSLLSAPLEVRGLPLSPLIQKFAGELLDKLDQLPLKPQKE